LSSFFRITVYICLALVCFNLALIFVDSLGVFPYTSASGKEITNTSSALYDFAGFSGNMNYLWGLVLTGGIVGGVIGFLTSSFIPIGISIFSTVFWATYIRTLGIISIGGYVPGEFLIIFTVAIVFVFVAAIIGMITGAG
jgi:hypothetical protein